MLQGYIISDVSIFSENIWLEIKLKGSDKLALGCVYRSPNSDDDNNDALNAMMLDISQRNYSHMLLTGDFNLPAIDWITESTPNNDHSKEHKFIETTRDCFWYQMIKEPTRVRVNNEPHVLDLVLCNDHQSVSNININSPIGKSDHAVIIFDYECYIERTNFKKEKILYNKADYSEIRNYLKQLNWNKLMEDCESDVNKQW